MAAAEVADPQVEKRRLSKAVKRKRKKAVEEPAEDENEDKEADVEASATATTEKEPAEEAAAPKGEAKTKRKTKANRLEEMQAEAEKEPVEPRGVIYVGHVPEGFFEPQMKEFFSQFGDVTRLRIARSKKNARSKGYAFVEFEEEGVAKIVADTMHKYLLFGKSLVCHLVEKEKQHPMLFKGCRRRMVNYSNMRRKKHRVRHNDRPKEEVDGEVLPLRTTRQASRREKSDKKLRGLLTNLGVDYEIEGAGSNASAAIAKAEAHDEAGAPPSEGVQKVKKKRKLAA